MQPPPPRGETPRVLLDPGGRDDRPRHARRRSHQPRVCGQRSGQVVGCSNTPLAASARVLVDAGRRDGRPRHARRRQRRAARGQRRRPGRRQERRPPQARTHAFSWTQTAGWSTSARSAAVQRVSVGVNDSGQVVGPARHRPVTCTRSRGRRRTGWSTSARSAARSATPAR